MEEIFNDLPEIIENNYSIAKKCNYFPREISPKLPKFLIEDLFLNQNYYLKNQKKV